MLTLDCILGGRLGKGFLRTLMGVKNCSVQEGPEGSRQNVKGGQLCRYVKSLSPVPEN